MNEKHRYHYRKNINVLSIMMSIGIMTLHKSVNSGEVYRLEAPSNEPTP